MKKENVYKVLYCVAIVLIILFGIRLGIDYLNYDAYNNYSPFYFCILERGLEFMIPSGIIFMTAKIVKKRYRKTDRGD